MANKSDRRRAARLKKAAAKEARMKRPGSKSPYAIKRAQQLRGHYRPTSSFYLPPDTLAEAQACLDAGRPLPACARV